MQKDFQKDNKKGAVTVFTALILSAAILLNCVLLQGAYVYTAGVNMEYKLALAGKSLLASFDRILYEDYGLIACEEKEDAGALAEYYFNGAPSGHGGMRDFEKGGYLQILPFRGESFCFCAAYGQRLADINVLQENITAVMQYQTPANLLEYLLECLDIMESAEKTSEGERLYREAGDLLEELSQAADKLYRTVEGWSDNDFSCVNGFDNVLNRSVTAGKIRTDSLLLQGLSFSNMKEQETQKRLQTIRENCVVLKSDYETYAELNRKAVSYITETEHIRGRIQPKIQEIDCWLTNQTDSGWETEQQYIYGLEKRLEELKGILNKTAYFTVKTKLEANISALNEAIRELDALYTYLDASSEGIFDSAYVQAVMDKVLSVKINCNIQIYTGRGSVDESLKQEDPRNAGDRAQDGILKSMEDLCEISKALYDTLPSIINDSESVCLEEDSLLQSALIDDYILTYLNNGGKNGGLSRYAFLKAETEYILNGDASDADNIENTLLKIFAVRSALNLVHVLCDSEKMHLAEGIGNAIAGAVTCGIGGPFFTVLVAGAWAMCEAALDLDALRDGEEVPLIKTKNTWRFSISGLSKELSDSSSEKDETAPFAMDYGGYLRLLLFMTPPKTKLLRIQDVIEVNLTQYTGRRIHMGNYCTAVDVGCSFMAAMPGPVYMQLQEDRSVKGYLLRRDVHVSY